MEGRAGLPPRGAEEIETSCPQGLLGKERAPHQWWELVLTAALCGFCDSGKLFVHATSVPPQVSLGPGGKGIWAISKSHSSIHTNIYYVLTNTTVITRYKVMGIEP